MTSRCPFLVMRAEPVRTELARAFVTLKFDVSEDSDLAAERRARYQASVLPALVFVSIEGHVVGRVDRLIEPAELVPLVRAAGARLTEGTADPP